MTSIAKKIPSITALLFFAVAALASVVKGGGIVTAVSRGILAGAVSWIFASLLAYIIFSEKIPEAKAPAGLEDLEKEYQSKSGRG
jgi:uncharacterized membrane protein YfcA